VPAGSCPALTTEPTPALAPDAPLVDELGTSVDQYSGAGAPCRRAAPPSLTLLWNSDSRVGRSIRVDLAIAFSLDGAARRGPVDVRRAAAEWGMAHDCQVNYAGAVGGDAIDLQIRRARAGKGMARAPPARAEGMGLSERSSSDA